MLVLDTDVISIVQRGDSPEHRRLVERIDASGLIPYVTITSFEEQVRGWLSECSRARTADDYAVASSRLKLLLDDYRTRPMLEFTFAAAIQFRILKTLKPRAGTMDLRIAAIALAHNATLVTRNVRDFAGIPSLRVEDWTKASR